MLKFSLTFKPIHVNLYHVNLWVGSIMHTILVVVTWKFLWFIDCSGNYYLDWNIFSILYLSPYCHTCIIINHLTHNLIPLHEDDHHSSTIVWFIKTVNTIKINIIMTHVIINWSTIICYLISIIIHCMRWIW